MAEYKGKLSARHRNYLAAGLMILSALGFSAMQLMVRFSGSGGHFTVMEQAFFRNLVSLIALFFILRKKKIPLFGDKAAHPWMFARSVTGLLGVICFFYATSNARIADANILNKLSPFVVMLFSVFLLRERLTVMRVVPLIVAFAGAWIVVGPSMDSAPSAMVVGLLSAVFAGAAYAFVAKLKGMADPLQVVMYFSAFSVACTGVLMIPGFAMPTWEEFLYLCLIGVFASLGQVALTYSFHLAATSDVSIYNYSGIVWSALLGWAFLGEALPASSVLGGVLIVIASLLTFFHKKKAKSA